MTNLHNKINDIIRQKRNANKLVLKFNIGLFILKNDIEKVSDLVTIYKSNDIDYTVLLRKEITNNFVEFLVDNLKYINCHLIVNDINNIDEIVDKIPYDYMYIL